ncbi:Na+/melibiose symporter-like transporter [Brachybacterium fresconis]|uniref:Na+/melibiose symporter-like transporter n=2 Tax=Brachybacterium fresconis TaxID=173363 RepID=A0ABS4YJB1_9MICO|nr:Na+/melibiose symporter-like transporter [Brachybacterium fresconis]
MTMRRILIATVGESTGDDAVRTLLPLIAVTILGVGGGLLGLLNALPFLWYLCAHRQIGASVDALGHRRAIMLGNGLRILTVGALILLLAVGHLSAPVLLVVAALLGLGDALFTTGHSAMVPAIVGRERTADCYQRIEAVSAIARVSGPAAVSALLRVAAPAAALALGVVAYLLSLSTLATLPRPEAAGPAPAAASASAPTPELTEWTVRRVLTTRGLGHLTLATTLLNAAAMISGTALVLFALETLGLPPAMVALFAAAGALGALLGAAGSRPLRTHLPTGAAKLLATTGVALSSLLAPAALLVPTGQSVLIGVGELMVALCATISMIIGSDVPARLVPQSHLGRAFAAIRLLTIGVMPLASVLGGLIIAATSPLAALLVAAGVAALACLPLARVRHWSPPGPADAAPGT